MKMQLVVVLALIPNLAIAQDRGLSVALPYSHLVEPQLEFSTDSMLLNSTIEDVVRQSTGMDLSEQEHTVEWKKKEVVVKVKNPFNGNYETLRFAREVSCC